MNPTCTRPPLLSAFRRFAVALAGVAISGVLFRGSIASGLVSRGDESLQAGSVERARTFYMRALRVDPGSALAAERYAFFGLFVKRGPDLRASIAAATAGLARDPADEALRLDRALCENALGDARAALRDFETLARAHSDVRYAEFAAQAARRSGEPARARAWFRRVLQLDPRFAAARRALARSEGTR